ncbi:MAG: hypothetical protein Q9170_003213 [Blastenia crenularia]
MIKSEDEEDIRLRSSKAPRRATDFDAKRFRGQGTCVLASDRLIHQRCRIGDLIIHWLLSSARENGGRAPSALVGRGNVDEMRYRFEAPEQKVRKDDGCLHAANRWTLILWPLILWPLFFLQGCIGDVYDRGLKHVSCLVSLLRAPNRLAWSSTADQPSALLSPTLRNLANQLSLHRENSIQQLVLDIIYTGLHVPAGTTKGKRELEGGSE